MLIMVLWAVPRKMAGLIIGPCEPNFVINSMNEQHDLYVLIMLIYA